MTKAERCKISWIKRENKMDEKLQKKINNRKKRDAKAVSRVLKELNDGEGYAAIDCHWDGVMGEPEYSIIVSRERSGETFGQKNDIKLTEKDFESALYDLMDKVYK